MWWHFDVWHYDIVLLLILTKGIIKKKMEIQFYFISKMLNCTYILYQIQTYKLTIIEMNYFWGEKKAINVRK